MLSQNDTVNLTLHIEAHDSIDPDELDQLTRHLMGELEELDVESVTFLHSSATRPGEKAVDPVTLGALGIVVLQAALPKLLEFMQAWSLRNEGHIIKIKAQRGERSIEVEYPKMMTADEAEMHIKMVLDTLGKHNSGR